MVTYKRIGRVYSTEVLRKLLKRTKVACKGKD